MSDAKHTPGPWILEGGSIYAYHAEALDLTSDVEPFCIADRDMDTRIDFDAEGEANGHIIAAAPDLLEALKWIAHHYANQDMNHRDFRVEAAQRAEAAIAKAEGK